MPYRIPVYTLFPVPAISGGGRAHDAMNLEDFAENAYTENCSVRVSDGADESDPEIL
jgi:hypothetical protein